MSSEHPPLLNVDTVVGYVLEYFRKCPEDAPTGLLEASDNLKAREIEGGNLNYSFIVEDIDNGSNSSAPASVFVKQAPNFVKVLGPSAELARERMKLEVATFQEWSQVLDKSTSSSFLPKIFHFDEDRMVFIMECLRDYNLLQKSLFEGDINLAAASALAEVMAEVHVKTHYTKLEDTRGRFAETFENKALKQLQLDFVFSKWLREDVRASDLREDESFVKELNRLKEIYAGRREEDKEDRSLLHGDLHAGSVMVCGGSVKLIDTEFAIYGPPGLDVGSLLSTYAMAFCFHVAKGSGEATTAALLEALDKIWKTHSKQLAILGLGQEFIERCEHLTLGYAGCEICRTALGLAFERSIRIDDAEMKAKAELGALQVGACCIRSHQTKTPEALKEALIQFEKSLMI